MGVNLLEEIEKRIKYYEMLLRVTKQTVARKRVLKELKELRELISS